MKRQQHVFVDGWTASMWVGVAMMALAFTYLLVAGPRGTADEVALHTEEPVAEPVDA